MRISLFSLLPIALALASSVTAYYDDDFEARDYIDDLATRNYGDDILGARDLLVDISTRDLVDELTRRTSKWTCQAPNCGQTFSEYAKVTAHKEKTGHKIGLTK